VRAHRPPLLTHVPTPPASVHEAQGTEPIQQALVAKDGPPQDPLVDAASISATWLVKSREDQGIALRGPTRPAVSWQAQVEGASRLDPLVIDWEQPQGHCPQGKASVSWAERVGPAAHPFIHVRFSTQACGAWAQRACCPSAKPPQARPRKCHPRPQSEALQAAQAW
jgi:hypothetical protein